MRSSKPARSKSSACEAQYICGPYWPAVKAIADRLESGNRAIIRSMVAYWFEREENLASLPQEIAGLLPMGDDDYEYLDAKNEGRNE